MVGGAADGLRENRVIFADAGDVGPESWLKFFGNGFTAVFGTEDDVDGVLRVGVRHGAGYSIGGTRFRERDARSGAGYIRTRLVSHLRRSGFSVRIFPTASAVG